MKKLLTDTSGSCASLGIFDGRNELYSGSIEANREYNRLLIPMIEEGFRKTGLKPADIDIFGAALGPGSFTGIRVGVAAMKGMAQALGKKFAGVSTLDILAASCKTEKEITALIGAGRSEFYAAKYESGVMKSPYMLLTKEEAVLETAGGVCFAILENEPYAGLLSSESAAFRIKKISMSIFNDIIEQSRGEGNMLDAAPVYVRKSEAEVKLLEKQRGEKK